MPVYIGGDIGYGEIKAAAPDSGGRPETIRSERGSKSWPSYAYLAPGGQVLIGEDAKEQYLVSP